MKNKSRVWFFLFLLLVYWLGMVLVLGVKLKSEKKVGEDLVEDAVTPLIEEKIEFLDPPSYALKGVLMVRGEGVEKLPRFGQDWLKAFEGVDIFQGERIRTDQISEAEVLFEGQVEIKMRSSSELNFANLIPESFLIEQLKGEVIYKTEKPISVKLLKTLVLLEPGEAVVEIDSNGNFVYLGVILGKAKFAFIDKNNETQVYEVLAGRRLIFDL